MMKTLPCYLALFILAEYVYTLTTTSKLFTIVQDIRINNGVRCSAITEYYPAHGDRS